MKNISTAAMEVDGIISPRNDPENSGQLQKQCWALSKIAERNDSCTSVNCQLPTGFQQYSQPINVRNFLIEAPHLSAYGADFRRLFICIHLCGLGRVLLMKLQGFNLADQILEHLFFEIPFLQVDVDLVVKNLCLRKQLQEKPLFQFL